MALEVSGTPEGTDAEVDDVGRTCDGEDSEREPCSLDQRAYSRGHDGRDRRIAGNKRCYGRDLRAAAPGRPPRPAARRRRRSPPDYDVIWMSAGTPRTGMSLTFDQFVRLARGTVAPVITE
ncbi:hypothetical protein ACFQ36_15530 [Arthrobacter sp. GCM10027362]|uniref:hypothetical protein n=1 Tax=Arthrobacter sp. GCM10027362 TaxID=3273379 RepID=UPI003643613A